MNSRIEDIDMNFTGGTVRIAAGTETALQLIAAIDRQEAQSLNESALQEANELAAALKANTGKEDHQRLGEELLAIKGKMGNVTTDGQNRGADQLGELSTNANHFGPSDGPQKGKSK